MNCLPKCCVFRRLVLWSADDNIEIKLHINVSVMTALSILWPENTYDVSELCVVLLSVTPTTSRTVAGN